MNNYDEPKRILRKGRASEIPKFVFATEIMKAAHYAKFGSSKSFDKNKFIQSNLNDNLDKVLAALNGEMNASQVSSIVGCSDSAGYKWLIKLGEIGLVDSRRANINGRMSVLFRKI